ETIALSADGSQIAFSPDGGGAEVRDLKKKTMRKLTKGGNGRGLAFSPDGKKLFGTFGEFQAVELDVATGGQQRAWSPPGYLFDSQYLASGDLVATGHHGLMIFSGAGGKAKAEVDWIDRMGVAALPDASVICGISSFVGKGRESMDDEIVCFAKKP
ncbi:MAG: hypothetical protein HOV80_02985, partial [Polyangiaceae bacterium]|nr:hypothetical protein [Polyangiaceae bacterium]